MLPEMGRAVDASASPSLLSAALDTVEDLCLLLLDIDLRVVVAHGSVWRSPGEVRAPVGRLAAEVLPSPAWSALEPAVRRLLTLESASVALPIPTPAGQCSARLTRVTSPDGAVGVSVVVQAAAPLDVRLQHDGPGHDDGRTARDREADVALTLERSAIGMAVTSADAVLTTVNAALCRMLDLGVSELTGRNLVALVHPDDATAAITTLQDLLAGRITTINRRLRLLGRAGDVVWVDLSMTSLHDGVKRLPTYLVQFVDASTEVANFEVLQRTAHQFRLLAESASDVVYQTDLAGVIRWVSPSVSGVLGWEPSAVVGTHAASLVAPEDLHLLPTRHEEFYLGGDVSTAVVRFRTLRGSYRHMAVRARALEGDDGMPDGAVVGLRDVTDEQDARRTLARSEQRFRLAMVAAPHGMAIADPSGCFIQVNPALCELLGLDRPGLLGRTVADFLAPDDHMLLEQVSDALLVRRDDSISLEHHLLVPGREVWVVHAISLLRDERGVPLFYVHQFVDQTEARRLRADLEFRASRDGLTGVSNREELMTRLTLQLASRDAGAAGVGVLFIDIDNLKPVNDRFGHPCGDDVITAVAERLLTAVRREDLVARIGGDEFVVVLDGVHSAEEVLRIAEKCRHQVGAVVESRGNAIPVTVSVGAVLAQTSDTADHVLVRADQALYRAKQAGRDQVGLA